MTRKSKRPTLTSAQLADRWGVREGSIRMMRYMKRGPAWFSIGNLGLGGKPRIRYYVSDVVAYEKTRRGTR